MVRSAAWFARPREFGALENQRALRNRRLGWEFGNATIRVGAVAAVGFPGGGGRATDPTARRRTAEGLGWLKPGETKTVTWVVHEQSLIF